MSSPRKSTDSSGSPEQDLGEAVARMHCLQALFPEWTDSNTFFLRQVKESIEASLVDEEQEDSFENFSAKAEDLRRITPGTPPDSHAFVSLDFSHQTWDPLFARQAVIRAIKPHAGTGHVFLLVRGLRRALFPAARYRTKAREIAYQEATHFVDELVRHWSTPSSKIHLLYL